MSGRRGSGSLGSGRPAGYAIGEERTSPCRAIKPGIRHNRIPGSAQARAGSPDPSRGTCRPQRRALTDTRPAASTPFRAPWVCAGWAWGGQLNDGASGSSIRTPGTLLESVLPHHNRGVTAKCGHTVSTCRSGAPGSSSVQPPSRVGPVGQYKSHDISALWGSGSPDMGGWELLG